MSNVEARTSRRKDKTDQIHQSPQEKYPPLLLFINKSQIEETDSLKYLGVTFDKSLTLNKHADEIRKKTNARLGLMRYLSRNVDKDGDQALFLVYNSLIRAVISYASPIFMIANTSYWDKIQIIQNKCICLALRIPPYTSSSYIHQKSNQTRIFTYCEQQTNNFPNRAIHSGNKRIMYIFKEIISLQHQIKLPLNISCSSSNWEAT